MPPHPLAGQPAPKDMLENIPRLVSAYYTQAPDPDDPSQGVSFGTSGHRGSSLDGTFNEAHVMAVTQALCEHRASAGVDGPLYMGMDTHALSEAAFSTALEVFAANGVRVRIQAGHGYTPTPVVSHAILCWNREHQGHPADGVVITPSHNPPRDGGFKYNPPSGGPAPTATTTAVQDRANAILRGGLKDVRRMPLTRALKAGTTEAYDFVAPYVDDLENVVDMAAIASAGLKIGVDPLGGSGVGLSGSPWPRCYGLDLTVVTDRTGWTPPSPS